MVSTTKLEDKISKWEKKKAVAEAERAPPRPPKAPPAPQPAAPAAPSSAAIPSQGSTSGMGASTGGTRRSEKPPNLFERLKRAITGLGKTGSGSEKPSTSSGPIDPQRGSKGLVFTSPRKRTTQIEGDHLVVGPKTPTVGGKPQH